MLMGLTTSRKLSSVQSFGNFVQQSILNAICNNTRETFGRKKQSCSHMDFEWEKMFVLSSLWIQLFLLIIHESKGHRTDDGTVDKE